MLKKIFSSEAFDRKTLVWYFRKFTWRFRPTPNFLIIGAMKCGTSSLFGYLSEHPELIPAFKKEVHFFDDNFDKGIKWYRANFPMWQKSSGSKAFEATPRYILEPSAAQRIAKINPKMKMVVLLRNPTERAISHYFHTKKHNFEELKILDAMQAESSRKDALNNFDFRRFAYKQRGLYQIQIEQFLQFFPKNQLLILKSEDFFAEPSMILKQIFKFVGIDDKYQVKDLKPLNVTNNKTAVSPDVIKYLNDYFTPHNQKLADLIGRDFGW